MPGVLAKLIPWLVVIFATYGAYRLCVAIFTKQRTPLQKARLTFFAILLIAFAIVVAIQLLLPLIT